MFIVDANVEYVGAGDNAPDEARNVEYIDCPLSDVLEDLREAIESSAARVNIDIMNVREVD
jgi:hypothetical protein